MQLLIMQSLLITPYYLVPLRTKYVPQYYIANSPQPMFFPQCERPSFTLV